MNDAQFDALTKRIDLLVAEPEKVRAPWVRLVRPVLRRMGWAPTLTVDATLRFIDALRARLRPGAMVADDTDELRALERAATREFEANLAAIERVCVLHRKPPVAFASWLRRLHLVLRRARRVTQKPRDRLAARLFLVADPALVMPPLAIAASASRVDDGQTEDASGPASTDGARSPEPLAALDGVLPEPAAAAAVAMQLSAVDHLLAAGRGECEVLARRRRMFEAARQVLLESAAALPLDPAGVQTRQAYIAREIARMDRVQAAGVEPDVGLVHQARSAFARADRDRLVAVLSALDGFALQRGDDLSAQKTGAALERLWGGLDAHDAGHIAASVARSGEQALGGAFSRAIAEAYAKGRRRLPPTLEGMGPKDHEFYSLAYKYLEAGTETCTLSAVLGVDGLVDVGGPMSPVRVVEHERRLRSVAWPTPEMHLSQAQEVSDLPNAIIDDPRSIVVSLAAGRLLTRRYVRTETVTRARTVLRGEVRVFVLDGSGSMIGPRARMRDAILVAELATLARRLEAPGRTARVALYYRYFTDVVGPTYRVDTPAAALAAVDDVLGHVRGGGTDIEAALIASFEQIRASREQDADLARAQIVLVTDGDATVDESKIVAAREGLGDLPIAVSVVALGMENAALREIVAHQRATGERAFYHYIPDDLLQRISAGDVDGAPALHLPVTPRAATSGARVERADPGLDEQCGGLLEELESLQRARDLEALEQMQHEDDALREMQLDPREVLSAGERARWEAMHKDRRALERRFEAWFPDPDVGAIEPAPDASASYDPSAVDAVLVALATVAEVLGVLGGSDLSRRADAIDVIERLLPEARLSPSDYHGIVANHRDRVGPAVRAVRRAVRAEAPAPR